MFRAVGTTLFCGGLVFLMGCGPSKSPVTGSVTLDGKPLPGATVVFTSEDGSKVATGFSDDDGKFKLSYQNGPGIPHGTYKVTVNKSSAVGEVGSVGEGGMDKSYVEQMMKSKSTGVPGGGGPMGFKGGGGKPSEKKSEIPTKYTNVSTTTISAQVPSAEPIKVELRSGQ